MLAFVCYFKSLCANKSVCVHVTGAQLGDMCQVSGDNCCLGIVENQQKSRSLRFIVLFKNSHNSVKLE